MIRLQYLLTKLAEEGSEVAQIALKTQQFGLEEKCEGQPFTNAERTHHELDDLTAVWEMLNEEFGFGYIPNRARIEAKKLKINKYAAYSEQLGLLITPSASQEPPARSAAARESLLAKIREMAPRFHTMSEAEWEAWINGLDSVTEFLEFIAMGNEGVGEVIRQTLENP